MKEAAASTKEDARDIKAKIFRTPGGKENIVEVTNCATRLRVTVNDESLVAPNNEFKRRELMDWQKEKQYVIVGLSVTQIREIFE